MPSTACRHDHLGSQQRVSFVRALGGIVPFLVAVCTSASIAKLPSLPCTFRCTRPATNRKAVSRTGITAYRTHTNPEEETSAVSWERGKDRGKPVFKNFVIKLIKKVVNNVKK
jgi:hypothetical protein